MPVAGARGGAQARCSLPPTSTPKIGHHDFLPHNNEPPTSLRTDPPAHPAYGLCSDSFEHLERRVIDSFGLHRAAQGLRLCEQLSDQLSRSDRSMRPVRAGGAWWAGRVQLYVKYTAMTGSVFVRKKRPWHGEVQRREWWLYCLARWVFNLYGTTC